MKIHLDKEESVSLSFFTLKKRKVKVKHHVCMCECVARCAGFVLIIMADAWRLGCQIWQINAIGRELENEDER